MALPAALLLLAVLAGPGPAEGSAETAHAAAQVNVSLERWDLQGARKALAALSGTEDPSITWLRGMTAFYDGEYRDAEELLRRAVEVMPGGGGGAMMLQLAGDTAELSSRLSRFESEHFELFLDEDRDWVLARPALETLEAAYNSLGEWLGHYPSEKVRVEIVPSTDDFERVSSLSVRDIETSGAIGICKFNKIMLITPRALLQGYRWRDSLVHEYIHYLLVALSANRAPIWLQEGVSRYGETMWRSTESLHLSLADQSLLARALREGSLVPFERMHPSLVKLPSMAHVQLAFAQCALAVEHLLGRWGSEGLQALIRSLASADGRDNADGALQGVTGLSLAEFEADLRRSIEGRGFREIPGMMTPGLKVAAGGGADEEWDLASWQPMEAQRHLQLAELLRRRGRTEAALAEYKRALGIAPASPYILSKTARVLLELSRHKEAERHLREALKAHPDYPTPYALLGTLLARAGRHVEALGALEEYLEINPFDPFVWKDLGAYRLQAGDREQAALCWETARRLNPADDDIRRMLQGIGKPPTQDHVR